MILSIGEILFDIFPTYKRLGGAPFNVAFHLKQLGAAVAFVSRIGNDAEGDQIAKTLQEYGFEPDLLQRDDRHDTGRVLVSTDETGSPQFDIVEDVAYDYLELNEPLQTKLKGPVSLLYVGSLIQRSNQGFALLQDILEHKQTHTKVLYDVNLRPRCYNRKIIEASLKHTDILKINAEELETLNQMFTSGQNDERFIQFLFDQFPLEIVALTRGGEGCELFTAIHHTVHPAAAVTNMVDTVGAGDGFASILAIGYLQNWSPDKLLAAATTFAGRICGIKGALPEETGFYEAFKNTLGHHALT